jgi:hypothetical protein
MRIARALFVGSYRLANACISLKFDNHLLGIQQTYVFSNFKTEYIKSVFQNHEIDISNFIFVNDAELVKQNKKILNWRWHPDLGSRRTHLMQQGYKFTALDYIDADIILIQDADIFCIQDYQCWTDQLNIFGIYPGDAIVKDRPGFYKHLEILMGIPRQTEFSFINDIMPVQKKDWISMKEAIETKFSDNWLSAIYNSIPISDGSQELCEYEILANWSLVNNKVSIIKQKRFEIQNLQQFDRSLYSDCNCVSDEMYEIVEINGVARQTSISDRMLPIENGVVKNFDQLLAKLKK